MVKAQAHERHDLDHAQALLQAPGEERTVLRGHEDTWARKGAPARDQCLEVFGALPDRMAEERQRRAIAADAARMLDHQSGALHGRLAHFPPRSWPCTSRQTRSQAAPSAATAGRTV